VPTSAVATNVVTTMRNALFTSIAPISSEIMGKYSQTPPSK
jgi:hypothetical protein